MKFITSLLLIVVINTSFGQTFNRTFFKPDFQNLMDNGVFYLKTGDSLRDAVFISALNENWDVTEVNVYDPNEEGAESLTGDEIFFVEANFRYEYRDVLGLIPLKFLGKRNESKPYMIGFIATNGFDQKRDSITKMKYLDLIISGLNDIVEVIKDDQIKKVGVAMYKKIDLAIQSRSRVLAKKTLLIVGKTERFIDEAALIIANIKFKKVTIAEYDNMEADELSKYCLLYYGYNFYTEIAIYDLEDNQLIYTRHYPKGRTKLASAEIAAIQKSW